MKITESYIIKKYLKPLTFNNKNSLKLEDDVYYNKKKKFLFTNDIYEEGVHFFSSQDPKKFVKKVFRSAISDILSKGVQPNVFFLSLSLKKISKKWLNIFKIILTAEAKKYGLYLGGGDTVKSKKFGLSISVIGFIKHKPILRSTSKVKDDIYVTGNLGDSFLGLLIEKKKLNTKIYSNYFKKKFYEPDLPFKYSKFINKFSSSSMDLSDGIIKDLKNLCNSSKCGANIYFSKLPFSKPVLKLFKKKKFKLEDIFSRGDDYQLLFTANPNLRNSVKFFAKKTGTKVSRIGHIIKKKEVKLVKDNKTIKLSAVKQGFIHNFS